MCFIMLPFDYIAGKIIQVSIYICIDNILRLKDAMQTVIFSGKLKF